MKKKYSDNLKIFFILFFVILTNIDLYAKNSSRTQKIFIGLLYNANEASLTTSNGVENHIKKGLELAISELGTEKNKLAFDWINVGETAESTLQIKNKLIEKNYDYIIGPSHSFQVALLDKIVKEAKLKTVIVSPAATSDELLNSNHVFLMSNSNSVQAKLLINMIKPIPHQKLLIVKIKDCMYCDNFSGFIALELKKRNLPFKELTIYESDIKNSALYKDTESYDHIFIPALEAQIAEIISVIWNKNKSAHYWSGDGVGSLGRFVRQLDFCKDLHLSWLSHYHVDLETNTNQTFRKKYNNKYLINPIDTSAFYYESLKLTIHKFVFKKNYDSFLTGKSTIRKNQIIRDMPILSLQNGQVILKGIATHGN